MVAEEFGIPTPKIIDPNDYLTAKQKKYSFGRNECPYGRAKLKIFI